MKTILTLFLTFLLNQLSYSQSYDFTMYNEPYHDLVAPISLNNNMVWEYPDYTIPIGFDLQFYNLSISNFYISSDFLTSIVLNVDNTDAIFAAIAPLGSVISDRNIETPGLGSASPLSYQVTGDIGSRIFKLEWKNVGFENDIWMYDEMATDYANFQLWCYESSNIIEFRYGESYFEHYTTSFEDVPGPIVCLFPQVIEDGPIENGIILQGLPSNPTAIITTEATYLSGVPAAGTVYRFTPTTAAVTEEVVQLDIKLYPNPVSDILTIENTNQLDIKNITLSSILGQQLQTINPTQSIDFSPYHSGVYQLTIETKQGALITKMVIKE